MSSLISQAAQNAPQHLLVLDRGIANWVLIPLFLLMFLFGALRHYVAIWMSKPLGQKFKVLAGMNKEQSIENARTQKRKAALLQRVRVFRESHSHLTTRDSFNRRKTFLISELSGANAASQAQGANGNNAANANNQLMMQQLSDPSNMMDMMKTNMMSIVPQLVMFGWVSYFFSGFVLAKFPFSLTDKFRGMVQRGVEMISTSLDVSYVTSGSLYFLMLFGMRGLFTVVLGGETVDDAQLMMQQQQMMMPGGGMPGMPGAAGADSMMTQERENLELLTHKTEVAGEPSVEERLLQRWKSQAQKN